MMNRRRILIALGASALGASKWTFAQKPKLYRIGVAPLRQSTLGAPPFQALLQELRTIGYVEGQTISIVSRSAEDNPARLPALTAELVSEKVDVILALTTRATQAAQRATTSIPIVMVEVSDPIASGLAQSLTRPGSNITGTSNLNYELSSKRLELLKEISPKLSRLAVIVADEPQVAGQLEQIQAAAKVLGVRILTTQVVRRSDFESVGKQLRAWGADGMFVVDSSTTSGNARLLAEFAAQLGLPGVYPQGSRFAEVGGLMGYGADRLELHRKAARYIDKILKGANPAELPIELPTRYELVINMKTAKVLRIKIPQSLLLRADRVIT